jgi:hypothetical protein
MFMMNRIGIPFESKNVAQLCLREWNDILGSAAASRAAW